MTLTKDEDTGVMAVISVVLGVVAFIPLTMAYGVVLSGYVVMKLWLWFAVPTFGVAPLSLPIACGLDVLFSALRGNHPDDSNYAKAEEQSSVSVLGRALMRPTFYSAILLSVGYVLHRWFV